MGLLSKIFGGQKAPHPRCSALVPAAGASSRMGGQDKLFCYLNGVPVLALTLQALDRCELIDEIVIAARQESILKIGDLCRDYAIEKPVKIVEGGANRVQSVMNAALSAAPDAAFLAVHDGARPFVEKLALGRKPQFAVRADEERVSEFLFELHELTRERRLRDVELLRRARDALLFDRREEIPQNANVHGFVSFENDVSCLLGIL